MEIRHVPSCYEKKQLPSITSTQLVLFEEFHVKQVCGPPTTIQLNDSNVLFPRNEEGKVDVGRAVYDTKNQPKKETFKYEQEGRFCIGVVKKHSKRGEVEIWHVPSCNDKNQLPSLTYTQLVFFHKVQDKQVYGPPTASRVNKCNVLFPRNEEGKVDVKRCVYETKNQPKKATFKYEQEGRFCLGVAKVESRDGKITGKRCPVFDYTEKKIVIIGAYKKKS